MIVQSLEMIRFVLGDRKNNDYGARERRAATQPLGGSRLAVAQDGGKRSARCLESSSLRQDRCCAAPQPRWPGDCATLHVEMQSMACLRSNPDD